MTWCTSTGGEAQEVILYIQIGPAAGAVLHCAVDTAPQMMRHDDEECLVFAALSSAPPMKFSVHGTFRTTTNTPENETYIR